MLLANDSPAETDVVAGEGGELVEQAAEAVAGLAVLVVLAGGLGAGAW